MVSTMNAPLRHDRRLAAGAAENSSRQPSESALALILGDHGKPAAEVERVLADDPGCVFAHGLRMALIVLADDVSARSRLPASIVAIAAARPAPKDPAPPP